MTSRPKSEYTRKCGYVGEGGKKCRAFARRDSDPPRCELHSLTPEQRSARAKKAAAASAAKRRGDANPRPRTGMQPDVKLEDVLRTCAPALEATFEHDGSPDWSARLAAAGTILISFPRQLRDTPEKVQELLSRFLPQSIQEEPGMQERLDAQRVYSALRAEWLRLPKWHPIRGLYFEPFPPAYVAPWENYAAVCRDELPADIPPDQAPVIRLDDGRVIYRGRESDLPLLLEPTGHLLGAGAQTMGSRG